MASMTKDDPDYEDCDMADEDYDELEYTPTGNRADPTAYQLTNVLPLPRATTYSTQALYDQIHAGDIDLEPEYQRDVVWPESKQIGLIDSILRNFYVPPIIFVAHQFEDGSETKTCIDGKQRLTSIHRFMDGLIPHRDSFTNTKYWYKDNPTTQRGRRKPLPERYRRLFANKQVVCIEYQDLPDSDEREIFQRVQLGMALTPAEKLQVLNTPMSAFVRKLQSEYLKSGSPLDAEAFDWDRSRGGDFRCITQALYIIAKYPLSCALATIVQLEKWLHKPTTTIAGGKGKKKTAANDANEDLSSDQAFLDRVHATFQTFSNLVSDTSLQPHFLRPEWRVSPIEFIMMCLLISVRKDILTLQELAVRIGEMRVAVRKEHKDIRMNARVAKTLFDHISGTHETPRLPQSPQNGSKRKREEEEVVLLARKEKARKEDEAPVPSQTSSVLPPPPTLPPPSILPPPRPDRLLALREARKALSIPPPRVTPSKPPTAPTALR